MHNGTKNNFNLTMTSVDHRSSLVLFKLRTARHDNISSFIIERILGAINITPIVNIKTNELLKVWYLNYHKKIKRYSITMWSVHFMLYLGIISNECCILTPLFFQTLAWLIPYSNKLWNFILWINVSFITFSNGAL